MPASTALAPMSNVDVFAALDAHREGSPLPFQPADTGESAIWLIFQKTTAYLAGNTSEYERIEVPSTVEGQIGLDILTSLRQHHAQGAISALTLVA